MYTSDSQPSDWMPIHIIIFLNQFSLASRWRMRVGGGLQKPVASKLGVAGFILGVLALLSALIPFLGALLVFPLGGTGVGLGIGAVVREKRAHILSVLGLVFAAVSLPLAFVVSGIATAATVDSSEELVQQAITFTVEGSADRAEVTYSVRGDGVETTESQSVALPWTITVTPDALAGVSSVTDIQLSASAGSIFGQADVTLQCSISVADELEVEQRSVGVQPKVLCQID